MKYEKHLSEPWYSLIKLGIKTCEGRLNKGDFSKMNVGDIITFENSDFGFERKFNVQVISIHNYKTFSDYLRAETLKKTLPGITKVEDGLKIYYKYYKKEDEAKYNIRALRLQI